MRAQALAVGIVGASGLAGEDILQLLGERDFPVGHVRLLGSVRTAGKEVEHGGTTVKIELLGPGAFEELDLVFFAAGPRLSGEYVPGAVAAGAAVVDLTSRHRLDPAVPLVVPEVNAAALAGYRERGIAASPSGTTVALAAVLAPLAAAAGLRRAVVSTYQGASGAGRQAVRRLSRETVDLLNTRAGPGTGKFAFNCVPEVGEVLPGGATAHEVEVVEEVRKVLDSPALALSVTAVRVPVFFGAALSVHVETEQAMTAADAADVLRAAPGILFHAVPLGPSPTPIEVVASGAIHVGRVRNDPTMEHGIALWVALDVVRKGAALNAVGIAEILAREHL